MKLKLPKQFAEKKEIAEHLRKIGFTERIVYYWTDRRVATLINVQSWIKNNLDCEDAYKELILRYPTLASSTQFWKVKRTLAFINQKIKYTPDQEVWKVAEMWQTPAETWQLKTGDCEDGALLIYALLHKLGIEEERLRIVAGDVDGGGHAYVVWLSDEDALEYPIDWCYWYSTSYVMSVPYYLREEYYFGRKEWWTFNSTTSYKSKDSEEENTMVKSARLSFKGYRFSEALFRNKDTVKAIIALLAGVNTIIGFDWKTFGLTILMAFIGLGVKLLTDAVDFYFSEVEL